MLHIPPQAVSVERHVIGAMLISPEAQAVAIETLSVESFYVQAHRDVFRAVSDLFAIGAQTDVLTVAEHMRKIGNFDRAGGEETLLDISGEVVSSDSIAEHCEIVREKAVLRALIDSANRTLEAAYAPGAEADQVVADAESGIFAVSQSVNEQKLVHVREHLKKTFEVIEERATGAITGIPTGIAGYDSITGGLHKSELVILAGRPKMGKEQPNSALVRVPGGWRSMGELKIGDSLSSCDGLPSEVVGVYPQGIKPVYRFTFADGRTARCGAEHLWEVRHRKWPESKIMRTLDILASHELPAGRLSLRMVSGHFEPTKNLPVDPWLLGFLIGDGGLTSSVRFSTIDLEIIERIKSTIGESYSITPCGKCDYRIATPRGKVNPLRESLKSLGLFGVKSPDKRIPSQYLYADREQRLELLRGLVDSDGWVEKYGCVQIASSSEWLASDIRDLVWSLGGKATLRQKKTKKLDAFIVTINLGPGVVPAWLPRKVARLKGGRGSQQWLTIKAVEQESYAEECTCIMVSHPSSLYVTNDYIVTHNTALGLGIAAHAASVEKKVAFFSLEMAAHELCIRILGLTSGVANTAINMGRFGGADAQRVHDASKALAERGIWIDAAASKRPMEILSQCKRMRAQHGLDLIVVDYLQLLTGNDKGRGNREQEVASISRFLKRIAMEMDLPVLCLAQLSRDTEKRSGDIRPRASDLRESGSIEQDANVVALLHRPEYYDKNAEPNKAELIIDLSRNCPPFSVDLTYHGATTKYTDYVKPAFSAEAFTNGTPQTGGRYGRDN